MLGDDVFARLDEFLAKGYEMRDMDTGEPLAAIRDRILSANAYIGAFPLAEALDTGADVVMAGRSTDTALTLAPMIHRFGWQPDEFDKLAAGTIAGHIIECGAQSTGGNCQVDWQNHPRHGGYRLPHRRSRTRTALSRSPSIPPPAGASALRHRQGATALRAGRPDALHHARLRGRFHHHPACGCRPGPRARHAASAAARARPP